jgi:hypothetical protein
MTQSRRNDKMRFWPHGLSPQELGSINTANFCQVFPPRETDTSDDIILFALAHRSLSVVTKDKRARRIKTTLRPASTCQANVHHLAAELLASSPARAEGFALAMHERACWGYDRALVEFWAEVLQLVKMAKQKINHTK